MHVEFRQGEARVLEDVDSVYVCGRRLNWCDNDVHVGGSCGLKSSISAGVFQGVSMSHSSSPTVL